MRAKILIDEAAFLSLDTHRAYETVLKEWNDGGKASTGRGISPAYADILLRQPIQMRDLVSFDRTKIQAHYRLYQALIKGLGKDLKKVEVVALNLKGTHSVGDEKAFITRLRTQIKTLVPYTQDVYEFMLKNWNNTKTSFVFEKAQAIGLDTRYGVYPDVTASDTTFAGIHASTDGIVDPEKIQYRAAVLKATYMSSVGTRILPSKMEEKLAHRIREDAHEYGTTTGRPRGIAYLDIPAIRFFTRSGKANCLVLTHMDITYPDVPVKVCIKYEINGKEAPYRPDQKYLLTAKAVYITLKPWSKEEIRKTKKAKDLPQRAKLFIRFLEKQIGFPVLAITTGAEREQTVFL